MKKIIPGLGFVLALAMAPAHAMTDWWLVFGYGEKPQRSMVYVDRNSLIELQPAAGASYWRISVGQVFEAAEAVDYIWSTYEMGCASPSAPQLATQRLHYRGTFGRDYSLQNTPIDMTGARPFRPLDEPWLVRVAEFVCNPEGRTPDNGMMAVTTELRPTDATWNIFWTDGVRPEYVLTKTGEEIEAEFADLMARVEARRGTTAAMGEQLAAIDAGDQDRRQREARRNKEAARHRPRSAEAHALRKLDTWLYQSEQDLVSAWGPPHRSHETNGVRVLAWEYGHDVVSIQSGPFGTGETGREQYRCTVQFESRNGELFDYRMSGNDCGRVMK